MESRQVVIAKVKEMGRLGASGSVERINDLAELLDILAMADREKEADLILAAVGAVGAVLYGHLSKGGAQWLASAQQVNPALETGKGKVAAKPSAKKALGEWLQVKHGQALTALLGLVAHDEQVVSWAAVRTVLRLLQAEARQLGQSVRSHERTSVLEDLVSALLQGRKGLDETLTKRLTKKHLNVFSDLFSAFLVAMTKLLSHVRRSLIQPSSSSASTSSMIAGATLDPRDIADNAHLLLSHLTLFKPDAIARHFFSPPTSNVGESASNVKQGAQHKKARVEGGQAPALAGRAVVKHKQLRKELDHAWMALLQLPLHHTLTKHLLRDPAVTIFPFIRSPMMLMDFFAEAFTSGGVVGLLALGGLFTLMTRHNLDYPRFYEHLYSMLTPDIFFLSIRDQVFTSLSRFLGSTHLPAYLVAAFIKRLCQRSLSAPPPGILTALPLVWNLLQRHPQCGVLIQRTRLGSNDGLSSSSGEDLLLLESEAKGRDPYRPDEADPGKSNAIDSSLWELELLQSHYCSAVSRFVQVFKKPYEPKANLYPIADFASITYDSLIKRDIFKKFTSIPTEFEDRTSVFQSDSIFETLWVWKEGGESQQSGTQ